MTVTPSGRQPHRQGHLGTCEPVRDERETEMGEGVVGGHVESGKGGRLQVQS